MRAGRRIAQYCGLGFAALAVMAASIFAAPGVLGILGEGGFDAERLDTGKYVGASAPATLPLEAESRAEEAIRLWTASRRTEMPEGTIVRCELLGVSAAV